MKNNRNRILDANRAQSGIMRNLKAFGGKITAALAQAAAKVTGEDEDKSPEQLSREFHRSHYNNSWPGFSGRLPTPGKRQKFGKRS
jgi:hypothetical protein